jgi:hypothetical protein
VPSFAVDDYLERCIDAGAQDLGLIAADPAQEFDGPNRHWAKISRRLTDRGHRLVERLALTESSVARGLYPDTMRGAIARQLDHLEQRHVRAVREAPVVEVAEPPAQQEMA